MPIRMMFCRFSILVVITLLSLVQVAESRSVSDPLFEEVVPYSNTIMSSSMVEEPWVSRLRYVNINLDMLSKTAIARQTGSDTSRLIWLNLFDDASYYVVFDRTEKISSTGAVIWRGKIEGMEYSNVTFATIDDIVSGSITTEDGSSYQVEYVGNGVHSVSQINTSKVPPFADPILVDLPFAPADPKTAADSGSVLDLMVVYTASARSAVGGTTAMNTRISNAVALANTVFAQSGVSTQIRLVHTAEVAIHVVKLNLAPTVSIRPCMI